MPSQKGPLALKRADVTQVDRTLANRYNPERKTMAAPTKELEEWLDEWPAVRELVDELVLSLKRRCV
jgi:hypothetical protein